MTASHKLRGLAGTYGDSTRDAKNTYGAAIQAGLTMTSGKSPFKPLPKTRVSKKITVAQGTVRAPLSDAEFAKRRRAAIFGY